jgi:uncharacterized protein involved in response to NO
VQGKALATLFLLWLIGRFCLMFPDLLGIKLNSTIDLAFLPSLPSVTVVLAKPILAIKQYRNLFFVPLLAILNNNHISCAIVDVLEQELPPKDHMLLAAQSTKLKITVHIALGRSTGTAINLVAGNITAFKQGRRTNRVD